MTSPHPVVAYCRGVMDGSVLSCRWVRLAVERHLDDLEHAGERGFYFDRAAAEHVLAWFGFLRHSKGEWAGQPFELKPWQQFVLWVLFGWKRARPGGRYCQMLWIGECQAAIPSDNPGISCSRSW